MKPIFVSSTFRDMQAERDMLAIKVIPELNIHAREYGESLRFVDLRWGVNTSDLGSDESSEKVLKVCLDEIDNTRPYMIVLVGERYGWIPPVDLLKTAALRKEHLLDDFQKSVTELEIEYGALAEKGDLQNCLFYFREPLNINEIPPHLHGAYIENDPAIIEKLSALKEKIKKSGAKVSSYRCEWDSTGSVLTVPQSFCDMVTADVLKLFESDFERLKSLSVYEREEINSKLWAAEKAVHFSARDSLIADYIQKITDKDTRLFLLRGVSGSGKSTAMAKMFEMLPKETISPDKDKAILKTETFFFTAGISKQSQTALDMLKQIVSKLERLTGRLPHLPDETEDSDITVHKLAQYFEDYAFAYAAATKAPLYIFCDAVDSLTQDEAVANFSWLPKHLPKTVTVVVSSLDSLEVPPFLPFDKNREIEHLHPLSPTEIPQVAQGIAEANGKELAKGVIDAISKLDGAVSPLYVGLAVQRLLMMDSDDFAKVAAGGGDMEAINSYMLSLVDTFPHSPQEMAVSVLTEASDRINPDFCGMVAGLLAVSRRGLRESDLQAIFTAEGQQYLGVDLALFTRYMDSFFAYRNDSRLDFTHRIIRDGFKTEADITNRNKQILHHLKTLPNTDNIKLSEVVYHAYKADDKHYLSAHIDELYESGSKEGLCITAEELRSIALADMAWFNAFAEYAITEGESEHFVKLATVEFYSAFSISVEESTLLAEALTKITEVVKLLPTAKLNTQKRRELAITYLLIGHVYRARGEYREATEFYVKSLVVRKALCRESGDYIAKRDIIAIQLNIGDLCRLGSQYDEAIERYTECLRIAGELLAESETVQIHEDFVSIYERLGELYKAKSEFETALDFFKKALSERQTLADILDTAEAKSAVVIGEGKIAGVLYELGDYYGALELYINLHNEQGAIVEQTRSFTAYHELSETYLRLGEIFEKISDLKRAIYEYEKSVAIKKILLKQLKIPRITRDLAVAKSKVADVSYTYGDHYKAEELYKEAHKAFSNVAELLDTPTAKRDLAVSHGKLATMQQRIYDNRIKAVEEQQKGLDILLAIDESHHTPDIKRLIAIGHEKIAGYYILLMRKAEAKELFATSLSMFDELAKTIKTPESERDLALSHIHNGDYAKNAGDPNTALDHYFTAHEISYEMIQKYNTIDAYRITYEVTTDIASIYNTEGEYDLALDWFEYCVKVVEEIVKHVKTRRSYFDVYAANKNAANMANHLGQTEKGAKYDERATEALAIRDTL